MAKKARKVTTLKHGKGKVHEPKCPWLNGPNAHTDWSKYHDVERASVRTKAHCSHC